MVKEKVTIGSSGGFDSFLPPVTELITWLGGPSKVHTLVFSALQELGLGGPSRNTIEAAFNGGVTARSADRIKDGLDKIIGHYGLDGVDSRSVENLIGFGINGADWLAFARGVVAGLNRYQRFRSIEINRVHAFLENRANAEETFIGSVQKRKSHKRSGKGEPDLLRAAITQLFSEHTLIEAGDSRVYSDAIVSLYSDNDNANLEEFAITLKASFNLRVDFYHQLLANLIADMAAVRDSLDLPEGLIEMLDRDGAMSEMMPEWREGKLLTPTTKLYKLWSRVFASGDVPVSYREMAKHVPRPLPVRSNRPATSVDSEDVETRRRRLHEWRTGTVPTTDQLTLFLESLTKNRGGAFLPFLMTRISTVWTKWIQEELEKVDKLTEQVPGLSNCLKFEDYILCFSRYPLYWKRVKGQATV